MKSYLDDALEAWEGSKIAREQSSLIGQRRSKVSVDFAPPPSDGGRIAPELAHSKFNKLRKIN